MILNGNNSKTNLIQGDHLQNCEIPRYFVELPGGGALLAPSGKCADRTAQTRTRSAHFEQNWTLGPTLAYS